MKSITKKQLIKALETEPLFPGNWINTNMKVGETCAVCAVGAVIRRKLHVSETPGITGSPTDFTQAAWNLVPYAASAGEFLPYLEAAGSEEKALRQIIKEYGHWSALSCYFEFLGEELTNAQMEVAISDIDTDGRTTLNNLLIEHCRLTVVPKLVKAVKKYFPERIKLEV